MAQILQAHALAHNPSLTSYSGIGVHQTVGIGTAISSVLSKHDDDDWPCCSFYLSCMVMFLLPCYHCPQAQQAARAAAQAKEAADSHAATWERQQSALASVELVRAFVLVLILVDWAISERPNSPA